MYMPPHFSENRIAVLQGLIRQHPLGTLVTQDSEGLQANHIPFLISEPTADAPFGILRGHVARQNPVWQQTTSESLIVFQGASAYITPSWYQEKQLTGMVVPTYNYAVVHARGDIRTIDDPQKLLLLLQDLTRHFEASRPAPWKVSDAPEEYLRNMMEAIVGIEIPLTSINGKWKNSQNKSAENQMRIAEGLREENTSASKELADMLEQQMFAIPTPAHQ
ncbi:FMN-binding negative transcriptional regulator [Undibacterium sp. SXout7W]|uniref:FMN-binding negative transcriptional regulator n=1 Tax=Undibacterium sp. SXout7W TaxID=3413049 RepID=UPI003BF1B56A